MTIPGGRVKAKAEVISADTLPPPSSDPDKTEAGQLPVDPDQTQGTSPGGEGDETCPGTPGPSRPTSEGGKGGTGTAQASGYEILGILGRGGMGVVYKARQKALNRLTALKMILSGTHAGPEDLKRFQIEAEAVAKLQHSNIVQIYEVGEQEGHPFFSLEFVEGGTLQKKMDGTPMPPRQAAQLIETLARAMHYAHQRSIVHRDLKPANVLMTADGAPKITDFGLAKRLEDDQQHTGSGSILGTPSYMSPEQASGRTREIGPPADIYALGAILYETLAGRPPFRGETVLDTLQQVQSNDPVPPSRLAPRVPRDLETICLKCLEKEPRKRYASAEDLAEDLRRFQIGEPILARPVSLWERGVKWARRRPAVAALLIALAVVLTGSFFGMMTLWLRAAAARNDALIAKAELETKNQDLEKAKLNLEKSNLNLEREKKKVQEQLLESLQNLYAAHMGLAQNAWKDAKIGRLFELLQFQKPGKDRPDLRGFEWSYLWGLYHSERLALKSHIQLINSITFRPPEGKQLASGSGDGTVVLWAPESSAPPRILQGHQGPVRSVAFSSDGKWLASGSEDHTIRLWDLSSLPPTSRQLRGHKHWVNQVVFAHDGKHLASAGEDGTVRLWDVAAGKEIHSLEGHEYPVVDVAFSPRGKRLASASLDRTVRVWNLDSGKEDFSPLQHEHWVRTVAFSNDGSYLASGGWTPDITLWNADTGLKVANLEEVPQPVDSLAFSPDSQRLAAAFVDQKVFVWDLTTKKVIRKLPPSTGILRSVAFSSDGQLLASVNFDLLTQDTPTFTAPGALLGVSLAPVRPYLAAGCVNGSVLVWNLLDKGKFQVLKGHQGPVRAVAFGRSHPYLASASEDGSIRLWDLEETKIALTIDAHPRWVTALASHPKEGWLASGSADHTIKIWNLVTRTADKTLIGHTSTVLALAYSPDGKWLASGGGDHTVRLWDPATGKEASHFKVSHDGPVLGVAFHPDGQWLATAGWDKVVHLWEVNTGKLLKTFQGHTQGVTSLAFSPDGKRLVTGSVDRTVKVWDVASTQETLTLRGHTQSITAVAFTSDGQGLASSGWDKNIFLWQASYLDPGK